MASVAIIGGGASGLATAYELTKRGYHISLFERAPFLGGLAASVDVMGVPVERYYHFICMSDTPYIKMLDELGMPEKLAWEDTSMGYYYKGKVYNFSKPTDLLKFTPLSLKNRIRFGLNILYSRFLKDWRKLEGVSARDWLMKQVGEEAFFVIWEPLLRIKFGQRAGDISAAWIWSRAQRVSKSRVKGMQQERLGYLRGGTQQIIDAWVNYLQAHGAELHTSAGVQEIVIENETVKGLRVNDRLVPFDNVISTMPLPALVKAAPDLPPVYRDELKQIEYIGVLCLMLILDRPLTPHFWLNINDPNVPFAGIISYTNLNPIPELKGKHIAYIPFYLPTNDPRYKMTLDELHAELLEKLPLVVPGFKEEWLLELRAGRDEYAQPICTRGHSAKMPSSRTPVKGLYLTDASQIYPEDRGVSNCIWLAQRVSKYFPQVQPGEATAPAPAGIQH